MCREFLSRARYVSFTVKPPKSVTRGRRRLSDAGAREEQLGPQLTFPILRIAGRYANKVQCPSGVFVPDPEWPIGQEYAKHFTWYNDRRYFFPLSSDLISE
jgi:hypothetical protein